MKLELRDVVASGAVSSVNGCSLDDLTALDVELRAARPLSSATVGTACRVERFDGTTAEGERRANDLPLALGLVRTPASGLVHVVTANLAVGLSF